MPKIVDNKQKKEIVLFFRVTKAERERIGQEADRYGLSLSEYLRIKLILDKEKRMI